MKLRAKLPRIPFECSRSQIECAGNKAQSTALIVK
jgi:hypothetical protein